MFNCEDIKIIMIWGYIIFFFDNYGVGYCWRDINFFGVVIL